MFYLVKLTADRKRPKYIPEGKLALINVQNVQNFFVVFYLISQFYGVSCRKV